LSSDCQGCPAAADPDQTTSIGWRFALPGVIIYTERSLSHLMEIIHEQSGDQDQPQAKNAGRDS
jgi:hypothetical protein